MLILIHSVENTVCDYEITKEPAERRAVRESRWKWALFACGERGDGFQGSTINLSGCVSRIKFTFFPFIEGHGHSTLHNGNRLNSIEFQDSPSARPLTYRNASQRIASLRIQSHPKSRWIEWLHIIFMRLKSRLRDFIAIWISNFALIHPVSSSPHESNLRGRRRKRRKIT